MADIKGYTRGKSKAVTSHTRASRQKYLAQVATTDGLQSVTSPAKFAAESEKMRDALAMAKDLMNMWPCRTRNGGMPKPLISTNHGVLVIALPLGGHVIENVVTSDGKHDFSVDDVTVIPISVENGKENG